MKRKKRVKILLEFFWLSLAVPNAGGCSAEEGSRVQPVVEPPANYTLTIKGRVEKPVTLSFEQVSALSRLERTATIHCVEGWDVTYSREECSLKALLEEAGTGPGANTVILHAKAGYSTSIELAYVFHHDIMLACNRGGRSLPEKTLLSSLWPKVNGVTNGSGESPGSNSPETRITKAPGRVSVTRSMET